MRNIKNNPYYKNGIFIGIKMIQYIDNTVYKNVETALEAKKELVSDLKEQFGWDENHKEVAENLGIIAALEEELNKISELEIKKNISLEDVFNVAESIGIKLNEEQAQIVLNEYPSYEEQDPTATWDLILEQVIHDTKSNV